MRWIYLAISAVLGLVFFRTDVRLIDLLLNANIRWSLAAALFLSGILAGQFFVGYRPNKNTFRIAGWGILVVALLGLLEYSVEWRRSTLLANNQTVWLSAASVETVEQQFIAAKDGLFLTHANFNGAEAEALIDTGASLILLNFETAQAAGIDVGNLAFSTPVTTASGPLQIAQITLAQVSMGRIIARDVKAAVTPKGTSHSNLLGLSFLAQLDEAVLRENRMVLRQTRRLPNP